MTIGVLGDKEKKLGDKDVTNMLFMRLAAACKCSVVSELSL